jgi:hypothetical protein
MVVYRIDCFGMSVAPNIGPEVSPVPGGAILRSDTRRNYHAHRVFDPPTGGGYRLRPFPSREVGVRPCTLPESTER